MIRAALALLLLTCPAMACEPGVDAACTPANAVVAMAAPDPVLVSCTSANAGLIEINSQLVAREQALAARVAELEAAMKKPAKPARKKPGKRHRKDG